MAMLRNLRNMLQPGISNQHVGLVAKKLADPVAVQRSKQLPFRYLAAYRELKEMKSSYVRSIIDSLDIAILQSAENISGFGYNTRVVIASDTSGSMYQPISAKSKVQCYDVGLVLSMLLQTKCKNVVTGIFGSTWKQVSLPSNNVLENVGKLAKLSGKVGYATNGHVVIEDLIKRKVVADKVMFFTDLQMWDSRYGGNSLQKQWTKYRNTVAPNAKLYLFDLVGYGQSPVRLAGKDVYLIAGWSDKIFDMLNAIERGQSAISQINKIEI